MREIKFRFWKGSEHRMLNMDEVREYLINFLTLIKGEYDAFKVMQYTGLIDKNGREIYEGDIVEVVSEVIGVFDGSRRGGPPKVSYYRIGWHEKGTWNRFKGLSDEHKGIVGVFEPKIWCEIIGNIYENPELLEVKT